MTTVQPGRYRHYKGQEYTVLGTARHSETLEELVVYRQEYGEYGLWVRPKQMFSETVKVDGRDLPRFQPLGSSSAPVGENVKNLFDDLPQHLPQEVVQILGVVGADPQHAVLQIYNDAIPAPDAPNPSAPDAVVNTPTFDDQGATDLDAFNVRVRHRFSE